MAAQRAGIRTLLVDLGGQVLERFVELVLVIAEAFVELLFLFALLLMAASAVVLFLAVAGLFGDDPRPLVSGGAIAGVVLLWSLVGYVLWRIFRERPGRELDGERGVDTYEGDCTAGR